MEPESAEQAEMCYYPWNQDCSYDQELGDNLWSRMELCFTSKQNGSGRYLINMESKNPCAKSFVVGCHEMSFEAKAHSCINDKSWKTNRHVSPPLHDHQSEKQWKSRKEKVYLEETHVSLLKTEEEYVKKRYQAVARTLWPTMTP